MGKSATRAKHKYSEANYTKKTIEFPLNLPDQVMEVAKKQNKSFRAYVIEALEEKMQKDAE
ncbi:hypothetical protein [Paenibacillus wenxiniae]|uniref:Uncharacterized protein n=1 Tax=Paenibacillus wenxiniae TaxID=1636843 RepID=A0ABW4REM6_9BACL